MNAPYYLLIGGTWVRINGVQRGVSRKSDRPSSQTISLDGVRRRQQAKRSPRTWSLTFAYKSPEVVQWLAVAASGVAGDVYLYDTSAAQINMLDPLDTVGADPTQPTVAVNTVQLRTFAAGYTLTTRVRAGIAYHLQGVTTGTAASTLGTYNLGAGAVNIIAPAGTGARGFSATFTPLTDAIVTVIIVVAGVTSGLRLTEGSLDMLGFLPGQKAVCQISVDDPDSVLDLLLDTQLSLSTHTVNLLEVG